MSRRMGLLWIGCLTLAPLVCQAADNAPDVTYEQAKGLFTPGDQDDCLDGPYRAKPEDQWLALVETAQGLALQNAVITPQGKVKAVHGKVEWFFKASNLPSRAGPVVATKLETISTNDPDRPQINFRFAGKRWHWIDWGAWDDKAFFLTDGVSRWSLAGDPAADATRLMLKTNIKVPGSYMHALETPGAFETGAMREDGYANGTYLIIWAGDLNHDGLLDFIVSSSHVEAAGNELWIGEKSRNGDLQFKRVASANEGCD